MYLFELQFCLDICPGAGLLDHMVILFLIFCFDDLSIGVSGVLKSPTILVLLSISLFMCASVFPMY